jgi:hypothetical protein
MIAGAVVVRYPPVVSPSPPVAITGRDGHPIRACRVRCHAGPASLAPVLALGALLAACTPLGLARGDYWAGTSTGDVATCPAFEFDLVLEGGRVGGWATTEFEWGTASWELRGLVGEERRVTLETVTDDPRVVSRRRLSWTGTYNPVWWELVQTTADPPCPRPRSVKLQRK